MTKIPRKSAKVKKRRLDEILVDRQLVDSRSQAKALILAGKVRTGTVILDKAGKSYPEDLELTLERPPRFVSRGGEKLEGFLDEAGIEVTAMTILDIGASTGGFTDCLLQRGAREAVCVDVGRAQLHHKLRIDSRVTNIEKYNARYLRSEDLPHEKYELSCMDVSFISLTLILPAVWPCLKTGGYLIALIKPQFEAEKAEVDKGSGIIRDPAIHERVCRKIQEFARDALAGCREIKLMESPIKGMDGNKEFLIGWRKEG